MKDKRKLIRTIILFGISFVGSYLINFFLTRFVTKNVGTDAYGFISLANTFAQYAMILTTALNSFATRFIALAYHKDDFETSNHYFNSVLFGDIFLGGVLIIFSIIFTLFMDKILNVSHFLSFDVHVLFILAFINISVNLSSTVFQSAAIIKNELEVVSVVKTVSKVLEGGILLLLFTNLKPHIYYVGIGFLTTSNIIAITNLIIKDKYAKELKVNFSYFRMKYIKKLVINGIWNSFNSLGNTLNSGLDLLISNTMLSSVAMGQASIVKSLNTIFSSIYQMVSQPFEPVFLKDYSMNDKSFLIKDLQFSMKISGALSNLFFAGFVAFGLEYYKLWVPHENVRLLYNLTIIAIATCILDGAMYPLYYIYTLTLKMKLPCIITILGGIVNVVGMFILIKFTDLGIYSVFLTTAFVMIIINGITNPIYMSYCLNLSIKTFYSVLIKHIFSCLIQTIVFLIITKQLHIYNWITLIFWAIICGVIGIIIHFIVVTNKDEKLKILNFIISKFC